MQARTEFLRPAIAALTFTASAIALAPAGNAAPAETCLAAPKGAAPQGSHWYYRLERPSMRRCWYLADKGRTVAQRATAPTAPQAEPDEEADTAAPGPSALPAPAANAPAANAASVPAAEPQPVITTLTTRNVSNADQIAQAPESTQPAAAPNASPGTMTADAPPLAPEQAPGNQQIEKAVVQQPAPQPVAAALTAEPASASTDTMTTLQFLLGAIALTGLLASAVFLVMAALRRRNDVLNIRREMDALPFEPSPETAGDDSPSFRLMPAIDAIRQRDDIDEVLERMARRRRAA